MKNAVLNYGGIILFYLVVIFGIIYLNDTKPIMQESKIEYSIYK